MLSQVTGRPARFVRKEAKTYGTCQLAEGGDIDGARLCIVEDVVTSGGAVLDAAVELRARGAVLGTVVCVIDRESGGADQLAAAGLELHALFTMSRAPSELTGTLQASSTSQRLLELGLRGRGVRLEPLDADLRLESAGDAAGLFVGEAGLREVVARRAAAVSRIRASEQQQRADRDADQCRAGPHVGQCTVNVPGETT